MDKDKEKEIDLVKKILNEEQQRVYIYPDKSILDTLKNEFEDKAQFAFVEKILGRVLDKRLLATKFIELVPLHFDEAGNWWMWDLINYYWKIVDETDILVMIDNAAEVNLISSKEKTEVLNALRLEARKRKPMEVGNRIIQFKRELINLETGDRFPASPKYFVTNPIPFKLGANQDTPRFDTLFSQWVKSENIQNLYEILAYCLLPDYPIERLPCLLGGGSNGKSTYLKILYTFIGMKNICTTNLDTLSKSRFETGRLYKKLACILGETNLSSIDNSQLIKRLTSGKDPCSIEFKNKGLIDFVNYAKIIVATNNLPPTEDKTDGFYRRWLIIEFPNQFEKEVDLLSDIPESEYENLAAKCLDTLCTLLKNRGFTNEGNIAERKKKYEEKSNPFDKFWSEFVDENDPNADIPCWEFEKEVNEYMKENNVRGLSDRVIARLMKEKEIVQGRKRVEWYDNNEAKIKHIRVWESIKWK